AAEDAVGAEPLETEDEQLAGRLAGVTVALGVGVEDEADLHLAVLLGAQPDRAVAEQGAVLAALDRQRDRLAVALDRGGGDELGQRRFHPLAAARLPVEEAGYLGARL